ncbi:MAG: hypothetical protein ACLFOY_04335 [Desulfatibacillaceae bacterium]
MRRMQLMELEDYPWCPGFVRDGITDLLRFCWLNVLPRGGIAKSLNRALARTGSDRVVDLCSGGGGPWIKLVKRLESGNGRDVQVLLTDLYPNKEAFSWVEKLSGGRVTGHRESVDATNVPGELSGFRTMFGAFHHFPEELGKAIIADAVRSRQGIAIFEGMVRTPLNLAKCLGIPVGVWAVTPAIRPFSLSRMFWTYAAPAIPVATLFDGSVSCLRMYSADELLEMAREVDDGAYEWETGGDNPIWAPVPVTWLIGWPKKAGGQ